MQILKEKIERIKPLERDWTARAEVRQLRLTKPPLSLGRLEEIACRMCAIQATLQPTAGRRRIVVFAGDHGVTAEGVSPYPSEVTAQMVKNFRSGGAAINALARAAGAELSVVDIGVKGDGGGIDAPNEDSAGVRFLRRRVCDGTRNMARGPAMTEAEMLSAVHVGIEMADEAARDGIAILGLGEMGIGNTTAASAITAALTSLPAAMITGRGTGADDGTFERKIETVERAIYVNQPNESDPLDILCKVGGLEIAGLCGLCIGAAASRIAIITDGFIATAAAALAVRLSPAVAGFLFAGHLSPEPGHAILLDLIGERPLLDLEMRLGEGTGAAMAMNVVVAAVAAFNEMATFDSAGVTNRE